MNAELPPCLQAHSRALADLARPAISLTLEDAPTDPWSSRLGGIPYWLPGDRWPLGFDTSEDREIRLPWLCQLNLAELPPLEGFPTEGLLQFWLPLELYRGNDLVCAVRYRPSIDPNAVLVDDPALAADDRRVTRFGQSWAVTGTCVTQLPSARSHEVEKLLGQPVEDLDEDDAEELLDWEGWRPSHLGGHASWPTGDLRTEELGDHVLLLEWQEDCLSPMGWTIMFLIHPDDLAARDFSRVRVHIEGC